MDGYFSFLVSSLLNNFINMIKCFLFNPTIDWRLIGVCTKDDKVPLCIRQIDTPTGNQYVYTLPPGLCLSDILAKKEKIQNILKSRVKIELAPNFNVIITKIEQHYAKVYHIDLQQSLLSGMRFNIGRCLDGKDMVLDLSGTECHTGVFGSTGSGKSVFLNILVSQLILKDVQIRIIDLKGGVEFGMYRRYPKLTHFAITKDNATHLLLDTVHLMDKRYKILFDKGYKSYIDYNKAKKGAMPCVVVIIDEFSVLDKKECKDANKALFDLLSRARAVNITCVICTQRPSYEILSGTIKCNLKNFVCFKVENQIDSEIVLSEKGNYRAFNSLKNAGEGLLKCKGGIKEFKGYYLTDAEILKQIEHKLNGKKPIPSKEPIKTNTKKAKKPKRDDIEALDGLI